MAKVPVVKTNPIYTHHPQVDDYSDEISTRSQPDFESTLSPGQFKRIIET